MNDNQHQTSRPRLRVTGGIILGQHGKRPMAFADEENEFQFSNQQTRYSARTPIPIIGLPVWSSVSETWKVGPIMGRYIDAMATAWEGTIPEGGCEFYIYEEYQPDLFNYSAGVWIRSGKISGVGPPVIVQRDYGYVDTESQNYVYSSVTGVVSQNAIALTRISVVREVDGVYYLMDTATAGPDDSPFFVYTYPTNFDTANPL